MSPAFAAVLAFAAQHGLPIDSPVVLLDGSNLLVHLAPAPVVVRVATFTAFIRRDPSPWLQREVSLATYLAAAGASVVPPCDEVAAGPHLLDGWWMTAWRHVPHDPTVVASVSELLPALDELHGALAGYPDALPLLGPATSDLDLALACCVDNGSSHPSPRRTPVTGATSCCRWSVRCHHRRSTEMLTRAMCWRPPTASCSGTTSRTAVQVRRSGISQCWRVVTRAGPRRRWRATVTVRRHTELLASCGRCRVRCGPCCTLRGGRAASIGGIIMSSGDSPASYVGAG